MLIQFIISARRCVAVALAAGLLTTRGAGDTGGEWHELFDGRTLAGWKASENPASFSVVDGELVVDGPRAHLFYVGEVGGHDFENFELSLEVKTWPRANSGVYFHTRWQERGWPQQGYEVQVNNSHPDRQRTAGIYDVSKNFEAVASDGEWFTLVIRVVGKRITTRVDGRVVTDHVEPDDWSPAASFPGRRISRGTICLQAHDPKSRVHYRNIRLRLLEP